MGPSVLSITVVSGPAIHALCFLIMLRDGQLLRTRAIPCLVVNLPPLQLTVTDEPRLFERGKPQRFWS